MNPLWFDAEKHPDKQELFSRMLEDEMETVRTGTLVSKLFKMLSVHYLLVARIASKCRNVEFGMLISIIYDSYHLIVWQASNR